MTLHEATIFEIASDAGIAPKILGKIHIGHNHIDLYVERYGGTLVEVVDTSIYHDGVVDLLRRLHSLGIYHGDIHPDNILVTGNTPKLIDFGVSLYLSEITDRIVLTNRYDTTIDNIEDLLEAEVKEGERLCRKR